MRATLLLTLLAGAAHGYELDAAVTGGLTRFGPTGTFTGVTALRVEGALRPTERTRLTASVPALLVYSGGAIALRDLGTDISLQLSPRGWNLGDGVTLSFIPFNAERVRPAFDYLNMYNRPRTGTVLAPTLRLAFDWSWLHAFAAFSPNMLRNDLTSENELAGAALFGAGVDLASNLRFDARYSISERGSTPAGANQGLVRWVTALGGSARLLWFLHEPIGAQTDLIAYRNDPQRFERFFEPASYRAPFAFQASLEGGAMAQPLEDPDSRIPGAMRLVPAGYADLQLRARAHRLRLFFTGRVRTLDFVLWDTPGLPPFKAISGGSTTPPELSAWLGADFHFAGPRLTPGLLFRLTRPASFTTPPVSFGPNPPATLGSRTTVVRDPAAPHVLQTGSTTAPVFSAKGSLRWDLGDVVSAVGEFEYTRDPNATTFRDSVAGIAEPALDPVAGNAMSGVLYLQARF